MPVRFQIVIPTKKTLEDFKKTTFYKCLSLINQPINEEFEYFIDIRAGNSIGLSELYQSVLNSNNSDYVIFMHDDVEIHDGFLFQKLIKAHEQYDIVGLAGAISQDYRNCKHSVWHLATSSESQQTRGIVNHFIPVKYNMYPTDFVNSVFFGPTPSSVVVIDGLFMSFKMSSLKEKPELFDRQFTFHHYDMNMCATASMNNLSIGVWPIFVIHYGLGEFANDPVWIDHDAKFKEKFKTYNNKV